MMRTFVGVITVPVAYFASLRNKPGAIEEIADLVALIDSASYAKYSNGNAVANTGQLMQIN